MMESARQHERRPRDPRAALPPPPPGVRYVRVPVKRVVIADDDLRQRVDRFFHWPMIVLALLILPLLAIDFFVLQGHPERTQSLLWWVCATALAIIWLAFVIEFVIKIAIAECRIEYTRRNWLDIVIILMPALRPFRAARLARTSRIFTLRGVGMKFARYVFTALIGLEATDRLLHRVGIKSNVDRTDPQKMTRHQLISELKKLRRSVETWEAWYDAHRAYVEEFGTEPMPREKPAVEGDEAETEPQREDSMPEARQAAG